MSVIGFIQDADSWRELLNWARAQNFADFAAKPESIPYRVENVLKSVGIEQWDGTRMEFAKGVLVCHYAEKPKQELTRAEMIAHGQTELPLAEHEDSGDSRLPF